MPGPTSGPGTRRSGGSGPTRRARTSSGPGAASAQRSRSSTDSAGKNGTRPAPAPRSAPRGSGERPSGIRASLTGRAAVLALVLGVLAVSYAYPLRAWYDQHQERSALEAEAERLEAEVAELETQLRLWDDPAYVRAQARARLGYVLPGDVGYVVVDETGSPEVELGPDGLPVLIEGDWSSRLWTSLEVADMSAEEDGEQ